MIYFHTARPLFLSRWFIFRNSWVYIIYYLYAIYYHIFIIYSLLEATVLFHPFCFSTRTNLNLRDLSIPMTNCCLKKAFSLSDLLFKLTELYTVSVIHLFGHTVHCFFEQFAVICVGIDLGFFIEKKTTNKQTKTNEHSSIVAVTKKILIKNYFTTEVLKSNWKSEDNPVMNNRKRYIYFDRKISKIFL